MSDASQERMSAMRHGPTRRAFLQCSLVGGVGLAHHLAMDPLPNRQFSSDRSVVLIVNVGGPSQLDTWDPKPDAPLETRGPFRAIRTSVPGIYLSELFPRQARIAHLQAFVRSCWHAAPAVHQVGWQLAQTGCEYPMANAAPHAAHVVAQLCASRNGAPAQVAISQPSPVCSASSADDEHRHQMMRLCATRLAREPVRVRERYGSFQFGQDCLLARCLVEAGVRFVTVRTFDDYRAPGSWDVHGGPHFASVESMRQTVAPRYDQAYTALVEDLAQRGMLDDTLVCCVAEFGRTPRMNPAGGRDHWPRCWTTTFAGGGVRSGQVLGASDATGSQPAERPVSPAEIVGTIYRSLGLLTSQHTQPRTTRAGGALITPAMRPIEELF